MHRLGNTLLAQLIVERLLSNASKTHLHAEWLAMLDRDMFNSILPISTQSIGLTSWTGCIPMENTIDKEGRESMIA